MKAEGAFTGTTQVVVTVIANVIVASGFKDNTGLTAVTIESGCRLIRDFAFAGCTSLTTLAIPR